MRGMYIPLMPRSVNSLNIERGNRLLFYNNESSEVRLTVELETLCVLRRDGGITWIEAGSLEAKSLLDE